MRTCDGTCIYPSTSVTSRRRFACADTWTSFFSALDASDKVTLYERCWEVCSTDERDAIVRDIANFFVAGGEDADGGGGAAAGAGAGAGTGGSRRIGARTSGVE
jgi:hypothetical protein